MTMSPFMVMVNYGEANYGPQFLQESGHNF